MADAMLSGLVNDVLGRLTSLAIEEFSLVQGFKRDILSLKDDFTMIKAVLIDAEQKHNNKEAVELWLKSLRSVSLEMENVLDDVSTEAMMRRLHKELGFICIVRAFFSANHNPLIFRTRMVHKVKTIRSQFDDITAQKLKLNLTTSATSSVDEGVAGEMPYRETSSLIHSATIFGRNKEKEMVTELICSKETVRKHDVDSIPVYAIWGMGGLGKTTLAQLVYNHERVTNHFELKCWMYVSENFHVKELTKGIIESIDKSECRLSQLDELQKIVQQRLRGKRFLVVLDDVWIEDSEKAKWEQLSKALSCGAEGSIVVLTTRSKRTSQMMAKVPELQHELGCLSQEDSWSLFKKFAFAEGREGGDLTELEPFGKKIVEKCKGLPLAVKTLGSLMWSKSSTHEWRRVVDSNIWELEKDNILPALKLSYDNLLPNVKRCFAYCCMLPKGTEMRKEILFFLWKANRLIPPRGDADWYLLGEEILNCLVWRSFFQVVDNEYKMHDLMHDLARYVMGHDLLIIESGKKLIVPNEVLHLSSSLENFSSLQPDLETLKSLRSVFSLANNPYIDYDSDLEVLKSLYIVYCFGTSLAGGAAAAISHIFDHVYLRVLCLEGIGLKTLPESICKLKHLKYLKLSNSKFEVLPKSIIYLQNLQVLLLNGCRQLRKLPDGMRYMRNLNYLDISGCWWLKYLPVGIGKLTSLRGLPWFLIGDNKGAQIEELGNLNLLGPKLKLIGLEFVGGGLKEAQSANLQRKTHLLELVLKWSRDGAHDEEILEGLEPNPSLGSRDGAHDEEILEGLEPNPSLEKLTIYGYMGTNISPSWMVNLRSLVQIHFSYCKMCQHIPPLGKLPSLRVIRMKSMHYLQYFHKDDMLGDKILFPQLQELIIYDCRELINLPVNLPKLKILTIDYCNELVSLPTNLPKLKVLTLERCNKLLSLPDEIQSFKDLNKLKIKQCENLSIRYAKDIGVDWPKISHIPNIIVAPR